MNLKFLVNQSVGSLQKKIERPKCQSIAVNTNVYTLQCAVVAKIHIDLRSVTILKYQRGHSTA